MDFSLLKTLNDENTKETKKISDFKKGFKHPIIEAEMVQTRAEKKHIIRLSVLEPSGEKSKLFINERYTAFFNEEVIEGIKNQEIAFYFIYHGNSAQNANRQLYTIESESSQ